MLNLFLKEGYSLGEDFIFSSALGLGVLAYLVYAIGSAGLLFPSWVMALIFLLAAIALGPCWKFIRRLSELNFLKAFVELSGFDKILLFIMLLIGGFCLFGALTPEIGNDALAYHIFIPKIFIAQHKISSIPFTRESLWPSLTQMLFTIGLIFKSHPLAKLFHYYFTVLSAAAVFSFTRRFFSKAEAFLATALFCSAPGIFMQSTYAYVDLALCFYAFTAFYAFLLWQGNKIKPGIALAGIFCGLALSVKLLGGIAMVILAAMLVWQSYVKKERPVKNLSIFVLSAFIACCVWYIRSWVVLGNPVFPFLDTVFKSGWPAEFREAYGFTRHSYGILRLPWDLVMNLEKFGGEQIGVIFLAFLPFLAFLNFKDKTVRLLLVFMLAYGGLWFWVDQNIRFLFPDFPVIFILIGLGFWGYAKKYKAAFLKAVLLLLILFSAALSFYYNLDAIKLRLGLSSPRDYLIKKERTFPVAEYVNRNLPKDCVIIAYNESRGYYFERDFFVYGVLKLSFKENNAKAYLEQLAQKRSLYILINSGKQIDDPDITALINNKTLVFKIKREVEEGKTGFYLLYKI